MEVALKIWRVDENGERELKTYEVEAPEWACLLDVLDIIKDRHDGTLAYRKSCRMMICGSCGMRMDGRRDPRLQGADEADRRERPRAGHLGDGQHADRQGPRRRHGAVLEQDPRASSPGSTPGYDEAAGEGASRLPGADERDRTRSRSASCAAAASRSATRWRPTRTSSGPAALAKGMRFVGDARDTTRSSGSNELQRRARHLGLHALLLLQRALPQGRRPARRDRQARRRVVQARHRPRHGRQAREGVRHLDEDDRLAARDRARAEDAGDRSGAEGDEVRAARSRARARCRRRGRSTSRPRSTRLGALYNLVKEQGRDGAPGSSRASARSRGSSTSRPRRAHARDAPREHDGQ